MKKKYKKPNFNLFPTKCHVSTLSPEVPEDIDSSRRSILGRIGLMATVGSITLLHGTPCNGQGHGCG